MKLRKSARGVLQSLRPKQSHLKPVPTLTARKTRYDVVLTDPRGEDTTDDEDDPQPESARLRQNSQAHGNMAHPAIAIHEDAQYDLSTDQVEGDDAAQVESLDGESVDDSMSECTDESDDEVDESVVEDMRRLEETFKGISQKYRLINRIGEGMFGYKFVGSLVTS